MRSRCQFKISIKMAKTRMSLFKPLVQAFSTDKEDGVYEFSDVSNAFWPRKPASLKDFFHSTKSCHSHTVLHLFHECVLVSIDIWWRIL